MAIIVLLKDVCYSLEILNIVNEYIPDMLEYGKLNVQTPDRKSSVSRTWGMTYENVFQGTLRYSSHYNLLRGFSLRFIILSLFILGLAVIVISCSRESRSTFTRSDERDRYFYIHIMYLLY